MVNHAVPLPLTHLELLLVCWCGHLGNCLQSADQLIGHGPDCRAACVTAEVSLSHSSGQPAGNIGMVLC